MDYDNEAINEVAQKAAEKAMKVIDKNWVIPDIARETLQDELADAISEAIESTLAVLPQEEE